MKYIPLTRGQRALVDDEDYAYLSQWKWYAGKSTTKSGDNWYAFRQFRDSSVKNSKGQSKQVLVIMHRQIIDAPKGRYVDHRNGNGLDNRKTNLRLCTHKENIRNQRWAARPDKPYKGVCRYKSKGRFRWSASIGFRGQNIYLGNFRSAESAARTYDKLAKILFGEFACLNLPQTSESARSTA